MAPPGLAAFKKLDCQCTQWLPWCRAVSCGFASSIILLKAGLRLLVHVRCANELSTKNA